MRRIKIFNNLPVAKKTQKKAGFNFLRPQLAQEDRWDKIYNWVSSTARVIVMVTEVVVIAVFVIRVVVDRTARDLNKQLEDNKAQLDDLSDEEQAIREIQKDTQTYTNLWNASSGFAEVISEVYSYDRTLNPFIAISISSEGEVQLTGSADEATMANLESKMKNSALFSQVELLTYRSRTETDLAPGQFQIVAQLVNTKRDVLLASENSFEM